MKLLPIKFFQSLAARYSLSGFALILCFALLATSAKADILPNIVGRDLDGKITSVHKSFSGKPMVMNFWWIMCSPCKKELPELIGKSKSHPDVDFVYVHAETNAKTKSPYSIDEVAGFLNSRSLELDSVIIGNTKARKAAGIDALPTTLLVDATGRVDKKLVGFTPQNTATIKAWLESR